jgi:hypothetical protein
MSSLYALVDYSDSSTSSYTPSSAPSISAPVAKSTARASKPSSSGQNTASGMFEFNSYYRSVKVVDGEDTAKVAMTGINSRLRPISQAYLDLSYYGAKSDSTLLATSSKNQKGNPVAKLGINWFDVGSGMDRATVDFYGGMMLGQKGSDFAATRDDKIFGIETAKSLGSLVVGLGYELRFTGAPKNEEEMDIGNIQTLNAMLGMMVSHDISFQVDARYVNVGQSGDELRMQRLAQKVSFGAISPSLNLGVTPLVELSLGADFRTKRAENESGIYQAKLWDMSYALGNSIHFGLNIRI